MLKIMQIFLESFLFVENMEHLSEVKKNLNCNIPRVKLQAVNLCKYKTLNRQKPRIIKSEIVKFKIKRVSSKLSQKKPGTAAEKSNLLSKKTNLNRLLKILFY